MPVIHAVDHDLELFVVRFLGRVTTDQIIDAMSGLTELADDGRSFRSLLIFERGTDLSEIGPAALQTIREQMANLYARLHLKRRAGAAMLDDSKDAKMIMPLWNALCRVETEPDLHYEIFDEIEPAISWLEVPKDSGLAIITRTAPPKE